MWGALWRMLAGNIPGFLRTRLGPWVGGILAWLGLTWATTTVVVGPSLDAIQSHMASTGSTGSTLGAAALAWMGVMNFDKAVTMVIGAIATKQGINAAKAFFKRRGS